MPTKIGIENALSSKDLAQVSRLLAANSKKSRFTPDERKQLEAHKNTLRKPRGKAASAAPNASAPANASANAPSASAPASASKAPSKAATSRANGQMSRFANVQSRFSANGSYTGKTRKGNATKLKGLLALKKDPFDAETRSKVEKMLADLEAAAPPKKAAPVLSAVAESNESSNESSAKKYFDPTTGAPMEEKAFFKMLKDSGLCKVAMKRSTAKKGKTWSATNKKAINKAKRRFANEYYDREGPVGASLESQSASS